MEKRFGRAPEKVEDNTGWELPSPRISILSRLCCLQELQQTGRDIPGRTPGG